MRRVWHRADCITALAPLPHSPGLLGPPTRRSRGCCCPSRHFEFATIHDGGAVEAPILSGVLQKNFMERASY